MRGKSSELPGWVGGEEGGRKGRKSVESLGRYSRIMFALRKLSIQTFLENVNLGTYQSSKEHMTQRVRGSHSWSSSDVIAFKM